MFAMINAASSEVRRSLLARQSQLKQAAVEEKLIKKIVKLEKKKEKEVKKLGKKLEKLTKQQSVIPAFLKAEKPVEIIPASTRMELSIQNEDGSQTILSSVDSAGAPTADREEVTLEEKIRQAAAANGIVIPENQSPMVVALQNASKNNARRNNK